MPTHDDSSDDPPAATRAAGTDFAQLVTALRARPQPRKTRRREGGEPGAPSQQQAPSVDEQLDRAETCSRSGRIDEAIDDLQRLAAAALVAHDDAQSIGWCDFVLALSHLNAGRAKEAVVAGYRAIGKLDPGTRRLRSLVVLASAVARTGDAGGALELLDRAQRLLPLVDSPRDRCLFWVNSGGTYHALGEMAQAVKPLDEAFAEGLLAEFEAPVPACRR